FEYGARQRIIANFFRDPQLPQWCKPAARPITESEFRRRDRIDGHDIAAVKKSQFLLACAHHDLMPCIRRGAGGDKKRKKQKVRTHCRASRLTSRFRRALQSQDISLDFHSRLNLKNFSAVSVVASAISSNDVCRAAAIVSATMRVCAGSERFPRKGTGARYGQSVSTINFQSGMCAATSRTDGPFLKVTIPVNETRWSRSKTSFA